MVKSKYFTSLESSSSDSDDSLNKSDDSIVNDDAIGQAYRRLLNENGYSKRIIHNKDIKFWKLIEEGWALAEGKCAWARVFQVVQQLDKWFSKAPVAGLSVNMGIFIRLFIHFVETAKECGQEKSNSNISLSSMDSRAFLNVEKMFKEIHDRYSKEILEWSKLDWPFDNTSLALRLKIEEYILVDPHFSLNLSKISLVSLPCELLNFDVALGYYRSMACNIKLQANSPLLCTNLRSIDISFNRISSKII
ncbi:hypothetical protein DSO57_1038375 [Entomophthora muscae]|uniref:Uncharacterized protein n=1 Tax=Entomophthora muscae TaxID=34485 RepID=A0ACC2S0T6_9FUNG|nr:hypothetical protein DSO57_1038375 [Entomophthora muscae]